MNHFRNWARVNHGRVCLVILFVFYPLANGQERGSSQPGWLTRLEQPVVKPTLAEWNLDYLRDNLLTNNSRLRAAYAEWKMKSLEEGTVVSIPDPTISMGYYLEPVETAQGPQIAKFSIAQTIPWFLKTRSFRQVKAGASDQAYEKLRNTRLKLIRDLELLWNEGVYLENSIKIMDQKSALSRDLETVFASQYTRASISHQTYSSAQIQTLEWVEKLQALKDRLFRVQVKLGAMLELDGPLLLVEFDRPLENESESVPQGTVPSQHPSIVGLDRLITVAEAQQATANANYYPDVRVGVDYIITGEQEMNGAAIAESGDDPLIFSLGLSLPIWNWSKKRAAKDVAKHRLEQARALRNRAEIDLREQFETARSTLAEKERYMALLKNDLIPKSEEIVRVAEQAYISQNTNIESLTLTRYKLLDLRLSFEQAQFSAEEQKILMAYLEGE